MWGGERKSLLVCAGFQVLGKDPFLVLFQFPFFQRKMWLLSCNCLQKLQALNCRLEALNEGGLRLSGGVTRTELVLLVVGFLTSCGW